MLKTSHFYLLTLPLMLLVVIASLSIGAVEISYRNIIAGLFGNATETTNLIVQELRLPRMIIGLLGGATLGAMGAALQGLLRNPLADPGLLGVSSSASLGAVIAIYYGYMTLHPALLPLFAMTGAIGATLILFMISARDSSILSLVLVGIGISALAGAIMSLFLSLSPTAASMRDMMMWLMGSLENRTTDDLVLVLPFILLGWLLMLGTSQGLNALSLGEDAAKTLGINLKRLKWQIVLGCALSVGAVVAVTGAIGFVGLIVPHMVRSFIGHAPGNILLPSAIMGAIFLTAADILTRIVVDGTTLRLGVVMALIGAPLFLAIIYRTRRAMR